MLKKEKRRYYYAYQGKPAPGKKPSGLPRKECLRCSKEFKPQHKDNWICPACNRDINRTNTFNEWDDQG